MKTLVDSSVWIGHFQHSDKKLVQLLEADEVYLHPFVIGELYLGKPKGKNFIFERLAKLPALTILSNDEVFQFIDSYKIVGKGVGLVDTHILGSAYFNKMNLYTLDKKLESLAKQIL